MCNFGPGDEIVAVDNGWGRMSVMAQIVGVSPLEVGAVYVCSAVKSFDEQQSCQDCGQNIGVQVKGVDHETRVRRGTQWWYCACSFRRVEKKTQETGWSAESWLRTGDGAEGPVRERELAGSDPAGDEASRRRGRL